MSCLLFDQIILRFLHFRCLRLIVKRVTLKIQNALNSLNPMVINQYIFSYIFSISDKKYKIRRVKNIVLPMMTSPDRYTPLPGFVTSAVALNQQGQPASINPKSAHKVVHVILQDKNLQIRIGNSWNYVMNRINPERAHKVDHVILQDNDVYCLCSMVCTSMLAWPSCGVSRQTPRASIV